MKFFKFPRIIAKTKQCMKRGFKVVRLGLIGLQRSESGSGWHRLARNTQLNQIIMSLRKRGFLFFPFLRASIALKSTEPLAIFLNVL